MNTSPFAILAYIIGLFILFILCRIFIKPIKKLFGLFLSCAIGCIAMLGANVFLAPLGITFSINPLTAMISGVLGLPGMIMTCLLYVIL